MVFLGRRLRACNKPINYFCCFVSLKLRLADLKNLLAALHSDRFVTRGVETEALRRVGDVQGVNKPLLEILDRQRRQVQMVFEVDHFCVPSVRLMQRQPSLLSLPMLGAIGCSSGRQHAIKKSPPSRLPFSISSYRTNHSV